MPHSKFRLDHLGDRFYGHVARTEAVGRASREVSLASAVPQGGPTMNPRTWLRSLLPAMTAVLLLGPSPVRAIPVTGNPCVDDAAQARQECTAQCKEDFQTAKDNCVNKDHACMEVCRALRAECREATGLDAAIDACNDTLRAAKASCRAQHAEGTPERDACIDQAQMVAFQCRDAERSSRRSALNACRREFRACARECPPANPPVTVDDKRQCRSDAKLAHDACKAGCREEFQFLKDACLGRDHVCMEDCRARRDTCRQPVEDDLRAAKAACNATRDAAIDNCKSLYPPDTPERDQCTDNAQVEAFQCKDAARESLRPRVQACRDQFRTCVLGCPPA
jgi:hypothetical protein